MKILLADDYAELRETLREALQTVGHEVYVAQNGSEALSLMRQHTLDALVTDILMPKRDGLKVMKEFRRLFPEGTVVAISGGSEVLGSQLCLNMADKLGADAILKKPFRVAELCRVLDRRQSRAGFPAEAGINPDTR